jgi:hypothetical protein
MRSLEVEPAQVTPERRSKAFKRLGQFMQDLRVPACGWPGTITHQEGKWQYALHRGGACDAEKIPLAPL